MTGGWTYMMANKFHGTIYVGVTSDLMGRTSQHRQGLIEGFTKRYGCKMLVWYEQHLGIESAIQREKSIKRYRREWKLKLIETFNPSWEDLGEVCYERENWFKPSFEISFDPIPDEKDYPVMDPRHGGRG